MEEDDARFKEECERIKNHSYVPDEEFNSFMQRIDKVDSILKKMRSEDENTVKLGMAQADEYLGSNLDKLNINEDCLQVKQDRCVINKNAFDDAENQPTMEMNAFMRYIEKDAKQRAEDRRQRREAAERHKNDGNRAFRSGNFNKALDSFNKALDEVKDSCVLYTNRALSLLKLGLPSRALEDTEKALKLNESSFKALIYKAQALHMLGKEDETETVLQELLEKHPEQNKYILEYTAEWYKEDKS